MQCYLIQHSIDWGNSSQTCERVSKLIAQHAPVPRSFIVLPEMFSTGFDVKTQRGINGTDGSLGSVDEFLSHLAQSTGCWVIAGGVSFNTKAQKRNNLSKLFAPDGTQIAAYQKIFPFSYGKEHLYFDCGNTICTVPLEQFTLSPFICYDLRFPEIFRHAALQGANLFTVIANWPAVRTQHWRTLLQARAIENQAYVLGVNRVGNDPKTQYEGHSMIIAPDGEILAEAKENTECVVTANIEVETVNTYRKKFPALLDIQPQWLGNG
jgi:omega-amidase